MLQNNPKLKALIVSLWNTFWSGGIANPITAIEQITYLLFIKRLDELESKRERDAEWNGEEYESKFDGEYTPWIDENLYRPKPDATEEEKAELFKKREEALKPRPKTELKWSFFKSMPADEMLIHFRNNVFPHIKDLNDETSSFTKHMKNAVFIIQKPSLLVEAVKKVDEIFIEIEEDAKDGKQSFQDIQGDVYEMLLKEIATAGKNGQFRTPRHLIKLVAELTEPKLGHKIADPACGTGGFLLGAYQYILSDLVRKKEPELLQKDEDGFERATISSVLTEKNKQILNDSFYGFDIDTTMVRLGLMNLMMHGIDNPHIEYKDTLSKNYNEKGQYDIVLANPPFTGKLDKGDVNPDLGIDTGSTELLFLARISKMLRSGGKAAVIIPEGVLFGSSKAQKATREILLRDNQLEAVISLPAGAFKPYTGVKTAILVFTKVEENSKKWHTDKVWFYALENDGYSLDDNRRKLKENPLPIVKSEYTARKTAEYTDRKNYFFVPLSEIQENDLDLSYNRYKEYEYTEQSYDPPKDILAKLLEMEENILADMQELNDLIG
ncbi:DNA methyltransferase [Tenacibaculum discolor]|uniref:site-specific DNA-methyltransferase (adenine-specific) n=1 Tax=Tenacibaculum discolor TaxID=361581 RepID=A0A2G1C026_9FLAO|nr:type I restriction-modification system subunit M [Tenacibaculum discolor]MDP2541335.1 N-6 DNA methylase [Tenacibaculum discolor]PHN99205.1 DNA methyltransferase [Tenacibaculum discolor]PHO01596.1 DNA methyltransferase [Rhodobacteraceae bacterium 4F10]